MKLIKFYRPENHFGTSVALNAAIDRFFGEDALGGSTWAPRLDVYEKEDHLVVIAETPGFEREEIDVSLHDGLLRLTGERKVDKVEGRKVLLNERFDGRFARELALPFEVDAGKVNAVYKSGVLTVTLPKAEAAKPRRIELN